MFDIKIIENEGYHFRNPTCENTEFGNLKVSNHYEI